MNEPMAQPSRSALARALVQSVQFHPPEGKLPVQEFEPDALKTLIQNLVSNAITHTPPQGHRSYWASTQASNYGVCRSTIPDLACQKKTGPSWRSGFFPVVTRTAPGWVFLSCNGLCSDIMVD